jgi:ATP-dependent RNA helicase HelY
LPTPRDLFEQLLDVDVVGGGVGAGVAGRSDAARSSPVLSHQTGGIAWMVYRWAGGHPLESVLRGSDIAAGDFVRRCKQIVDLLDQVADAALTSGSLKLARTARSAVDAVRRGVVAADRVD